MNTFPQARGRGRGRGGEIKCFVCGKIGHKFYECTDRKRDGGGEAHISEVHRRNVEEKYAESERYLMMRKILLNPEKEVENLVQRNSFFRTACKTKDRVCKVIVDSGSTYNLVSKKIVEKM
jgi:hypothetical protein